MLHPNDRNAAASELIALGPQADSVTPKLISASGSRGPTVRAMCEIVLADTKRQSESKVIDQLVDGFADETDQSGDPGFEPSSPHSTSHWNDAVLALERHDLQAFTIQPTCVCVVLALG